MLNKIIPALIILIFGSLTLFGFLGVDFIDHFNSPNCPMSLVSTSSCPSESGLSLTLHHVSGLQYLNQATVGSNFFFTFFILLIFVGTFLFSLRSNYDDSAVFVGFQFLKNVQNSLIKYRNSFLYWLALHNKHSDGGTNLVHVRQA